MATILIADDSMIIRKKLKKILVNNGHEVVGEAENGLQAVEQYRKYQPDLVTMDINMPIMDGIEAVERIIAGYNEAKIIMVSAIEEKEKVFEALGKGAKHYVIKPFKISEVLKTIHLVLDSDEREIDL